jgi:serine/threonine protein kinase
VGETFPRPYGSYVLLERLGSGGMSEVDLARRVVDDGSFVRFAVIKRIKADRTQDPSFVRMFKDEARITSELHHENIGSVYDFGKVGDEYYLALEYVPGIDCRHLVSVLRERGQRVPVRVALKIVADVLGALQYAHFKKDTFGRPMGIVHRDVNPRNVMLSIRGEVKLIDFGVAKATDRLEHTRTDHVKGKFAYMAPEQISGQPIDHRTDLYAVGLMLHELLTGVSPFFGLNQVQILHRMVNAAIEPLPPVPEVKDDTALRRAHDKALAGDPAARYSTAAEFAADLRAVAEPIGGLPTDDQLATFLLNVDPDLTTRLERKMEGYAKLDTSGVFATSTLTHPGVLDETLGSESSVNARGSGSLNLGGRTRTADGLVVGETASGTLTVARTGVLAGSVMLVSLISAVIAAGIVSLVLLGVYAATGGFSEPQDAEVPALEPPTAPEPVQPAQPIVLGPVAPAPGTVAPPAAPAPAQSKAPAVPEPVILAPGVPELVLPEPVVLPEPEPVPEPVVPEPVAAQPVPEPRELGYLSVTAPEKGLSVVVDGEEVGKIPLVKFRIPEGMHTIEVAGYSCSPRSVLIGANQVALVTCK